MRRIRVAVVALLFAGAVCSAVGAPAASAQQAAAPAFARPLRVTAEGAGARIEFAASAATDCAVYVQDAAGRTVRHLVAGVIGGPAAPPEPLAAGLAQSLAWDGKDDAGRPAAGGPFTVRVTLGLSPRFDSFMLYEPDAFPEATSLAVGPKGQLYVFYRDPTANGNQGGHKVRIIARDGKFVRQIMPFPADAPYEKVKATGAFQDADGSLVPRLQSWHRLSFYPDTIPARGRSMSDFSQPAVDAAGTLYWIISGGRLCAIDATGGVPYDTFLSEPLFGDMKFPGGQPALCVSGDGKHLYAAGITSAEDSWGKNTRAQPVVYRIDLATRACEPFVGDPANPGKEKDRFTGPRGVAVANGLLYVADPDAGRVAVFQEADRSFVGEIRCTLPHIVQVHPATGAVYVVSYVPEAKPSADGKVRIKDANLLKFDGYKSEQPVCQLALPRTGLSPNNGTHRIVLDATASPALLWAPGLPYGRTGRRMACYRDTGEAIEPVEVPEPAGPWGDGPRDLLVDRRRGELYVKVQGEQWYQIEEKTGKVVRTVRFPKNDGGPYMGSAGSQLGVDAEGDYITHCWGNNAGLMRWSRDLKPLKWEGRDTHRSDWGGMMTFQLNYMALRGDDIYVIKPEKGPHSVDVYDMGLNVKRRVVWNARRGSCVRVDERGNIYMTVPLRPKDRDFEPFFDGKLDRLPDYYNGIGNGDAYWYAYMAGAIVKFPPAGGAFHWLGDDRAGDETAGIPEAIAAKPKVECQYFLAGHYPHRACQVQGASWIRFGYAPYSETYGAGTPVCMCEGAGFDVDGFGRVFATNLFRFRVEVADANNNTIATFGRYGNQDSAPAGRLQTPAIPLAWPTYVAVSDDYAYVNDTVGLRVVRVKLASAAEQTRPVE